MNVFKHTTTTTKRNYITDTSMYKNKNKHMLTQRIEKGNGTPLQYSCLDNPMDRLQPGRLQSVGSLAIGHD